MQTSPTLIISIISVVISGLTLLITFRKFEFEKQKSILEIQKLQEELYSKTQKLELSSYQSKDTKEVIIYDGRKRDISSDFFCRPSQEFDKGLQKFAGIEGQGSYTITNGLIDIKRTNTEGRFEIHLQSYRYGNLLQKIPADNTISGKRNLKLICDVKAVGAKHTLRFSFKGDSTRTWDDTEYEVFKDTWETVNLAFSIPTNDPSFLRIDDVKVSAVPSNVQIRNIVLHEKRE